MFKSIMYFDGRGECLWMHPEFAKEIEFYEGWQTWLFAEEKKNFGGQVLMRRFLTQAGLQKLKRYCHSQTLFAFDYDGTLTPLMPKISEARLSLKVRKYLEKLHDYVPIVIVSGRSIGDLKKLCSFTPDFFIG